MPTYNMNATGGFFVSRLPGTPKSIPLTLTGVKFGVDRFGILIFEYKVGAGAMPFNMQGVAITSALEYFLGTKSKERALLVYDAIAGQPAVLRIPQPVGTGAVRGVPCSITGANLDYYIKCTQTAPT